MWITISIILAIFLLINLGINAQLKDEVNKQKYEIVQLAIKHNDEQLLNKLK